MRAEKQVVSVDVKAVHSVARRMFLRDVERFEVVELVLHLRSQRHLVTEPGEDCLYLAQDQRQGMQVPSPNR